MLVVALRHCEARSSPESLFIHKIASSFLLSMTQIASPWIVTEAERMGFDACGIAQATALEVESAHVERWLDEGHEGEMGYLTRNK